MDEVDIYIALTFDTDNDFFDRSFVEEGQDERALMCWRGIEEGVPMLRELIAQYQGSAGDPTTATWFVRADGQLAFYYDDPAYLLREYGDLWQSAAEQGHEIAWHPHLYRLENRKWVQERDPIALAKQMEETLAAVKKAGYDPHSSRIGEAYADNALMALLDQYGILCDSTAMPGRRRVDNERFIDWSRTGPTPYHPSRNDYQTPGRDALRLLEVPMSVAWMKTSYDKKPYIRYIDFAFRHEVIKEGLATLLCEARLLVVVTHPSTVLSRIASKPHGLLSFSIGEYRRNLEFAIEQLELAGRSYRFITIGECRALHEAGQI